MDNLNERLPEPAIDIPSFSSFIDKKKENPAEWMHERIVRSIVDFEKQLDQDHEIGARLVNFGSNTTFHIEDVGYWGPDIIIFYGKSQDGNVELLQHMSQLSVLLVALKKVHEEPNRIGFKLMEKVEKDEG